IVGSRGIWRQPKFDLYPYLTTWNYFIRDHWRFPLLDVPAMGYPEGASVLFTDALPIGELVTKAIHSVSGVAINPFGWWVLLTYLLQGAMAARIMCAAGVRSVPASIAAAILATAFVPFMTRIYHIAISSHFLILWAFALYLENVRDRRFSLGEHFALSSLTLLVNAYLFVMVGALQAVTIATLANHRALTRDDLSKGALAVIGIVLLGLAEGYAHIFGGPGSMQAAGFGTFSWNPATLIAAPRSYWGFADGIQRIAADGQREGESYLGLGAILVVATCLIVRPRQAAQAVRRHWILVCVLALFGAYAASNRVYLGPRLVADVPLPSFVLSLVSFFRANGRFIWIPAYALSLFSLAALFKWAPRMLVLPVILVAAVVQLYEAKATVHLFRPVLAAPSADLLDVGEFGDWLKLHRRLFQFPSWSCGGLTPRTNETSFREMQIQLLAARSGVPTNSVYTSRQLKDCAIEASWAVQPALRSGVLYVLNKADLPRAPGLMALATSDACVDTGWGLVCSRQPLTRRAVQ
ncbi:MAG TPA: DUF6311 domain-containing protein, partial [Vicinamibacterales bacterium]